MVHKRAFYFLFLAWMSTKVINCIFCYLTVTFNLQFITYEAHVKCPQMLTKTHWHIDQNGHQDVQDNRTRAFCNGSDAHPTPKYSEH